MITIRRLSPAEAKDYRRLRLQAVKESPSAYGSTYRETADRPAKDFEAFLEMTPGNWNFGAYDADRLIGTVQLARHEGSKEQHKASIHGLYVTPSQRGKGVGRRLFEKALGTAKRWRNLRQINLGVMDSNEAAITLYRSAGFVKYGREVDALRVGGRFYAEVFMVLKLRGDVSSDDGI